MIVYAKLLAQCDRQTNRCIAPDLTVMDCSIGMAEFHLGGSYCDPPVNKIVAGYNPWEVDREVARLLGLDLQAIEHVRAGLNQSARYMEPLSLCVAFSYMRW